MKLPKYVNWIYQNVQEMRSPYHGNILYIDMSTVPDEFFSIRVFGDDCFCSNWLIYEIIVRGIRHTNMNSYFIRCWQKEYEMNLISYDVLMRKLNYPSIDTTPSMKAI